MRYMRVQVFATSYLVSRRERICPIDSILQHSTQKEQAVHGMEHGDSNGQPHRLIIGRPDHTRLFRPKSALQLLVHGVGEVKQEPVRCEKKGGIEVCGPRFSVDVDVGISVSVGMLINGCRCRAFAGAAESIGDAGMHVTG